MAGRCNPGTGTLLSILTLFLVGLCHARPVVRSIRSAHEFDRLMSKHATETGLPVVVDFYSDSCGPCRMMAPIFKKVAEEFKETAVFVKVDTNAQYELSGRYQIRSLPTFQWFVGGKRWREEKGGIGEGPLRQLTQQAVAVAESENIRLLREDLISYYSKVDPSKPIEDVDIVYKKCADMVKGGKGTCDGPAAQQLIRRLRQKYKQIPDTVKRFSEDAASTGGKESETKSSSQPSGPKKAQNAPTNGRSQPSLHLATKEQLMEELEKRLDAERDAEVEDESDEEEEALSEEHRWVKGDFPERVVIIGGGPAGMSAAIYAARAGLKPLVIAPSMGGQLQGKGVDVENYPGLFNVTGPSIIAHMREQAIAYHAYFEDDMVVSVDASSRPLKVVTNTTGTIETHSIIVATGADSNWLGIPGEYEMRGGGVSSCATCDGFLFANKDVVVVGGGDAAMEDALVLARTSKSVTVVHRRDTFRASKVLADRVIEHPLISVQWNSVVEEIIGEKIASSEDEETDLDNAQKVVSEVVLRDTVTGETRRKKTDALFVAIGHTPNTAFLQGVVEFDQDHKGYIKTFGRSTKTSVPGIFAAGDVSDAVYRQAITSAGSGAAAALDSERWLSEEGLGNEEAEMEAELLREMMSDNDGKTSTGYNAYADAGGKMEGMRESMVGSEL